MSTPIINPPQSGVLGLHRIEDRAVVVNGQVVVRPMMYLALSYDHRMVDGRGGGHLPRRDQERDRGPDKVADRSVRPGGACYSDLCSCEGRSP